MTACRSDLPREECNMVDGLKYAGMILNVLANDIQSLVSVRVRLTRPRDL